MASPLFASQFRYAPTYGVSLHTGAPKVGATLGSSPKEEDDDPEDKTGDKTGDSSSDSSAASAMASKAASQNAFSSNGNAVMSGMSQAQQGTMNKLTHMAPGNSSAVNAANPVPETSAYRSDNSMFDAPTGGVPFEQTSPAPSTADSSSGAGSQIPVMHQQSTPSLSQDWNTLSNGFKSVVNGISQGFPLPGVSSQSNVGHSSADTGVTEPSNVWNPSENPQAYTSPSGLGSGSQSAIDMRPYSPQFKASFGLDYAKNAQAASEIASQPSSESIWGDLGNIVKNPADWASDL